MSDNFRIEMINAGQYYAVTAGNMKYVFFFSQESEHKSLEYLKI